jgi:CRISPR type III-A-associated RAMP protein Csm5
MYIGMVSPSRWGSQEVEGMASNTYLCTVTTLTPVHVGSGRQRHPWIDYEANNTTGKLTGYDVKSIVEKVTQERPQLLDGFCQACEKGELYQWCRSNHIDLTAHKTFECQLDPNDISRKGIQAQQCDAFGRPYIPGSSLKGSFRTAVVRNLCLEDFSPVREAVSLFRRARVDKPEFPDSDLLKRLLGKDPNHNLMRVLSVGDIVFASSKTTLVVARVISQSHAPLHFTMKPYRIVLECLGAGQIATGKVAFDSFLLDQENSRRLGFRNFALEFVLKAIRDFTEYLSHTEAIYCRDVLQHPELADFYEKILPQHIRTLDENSAVLNLGWGIGWRGMTGDLIDKETLKDAGLRRNLNLAPKHTDFPFPKSRKLAITKDAITPWGWIKLSFAPWVREDSIPHIPPSGEHEPFREKRPSRLEVPVEAEPPKKKPETQTWEAANLTWRPQTRTVVAQKEGKKAEVRLGDDMKMLDGLSQSKRTRLLKKRKSVVANVRVRQEGNAFIILEILDE